MKEHDDLVTLDYDGRVCCPVHGLLDASTDYVPGIAPCGCEFRAGLGGLLRAHHASDIAGARDSASIRFAVILQDDAKNAG